MRPSKNWDLQIDPSVFKVLRKVPQDSTRAIMRVLGTIKINPYFGDIQKMKGEENTWRHRIGAYRIFYQLKTGKRVILVFRIERRTSRTY